MNSALVRSYNYSSQANRIPFGIRYKNWKPLFWLCSAIMLFVMQLASGTDPLYACLVFFFAGLTYFSVQVVGGIQTLMGCAVFYMAMQNVLISQAAKIYFGQPGDSRLVRPVETIGVYIAGMVGIFLAGCLYRKMGFPKRRPVFYSECDPQRLMYLSIITIVCATVQVIYDALGTLNENGGGNIGGLRSMIHAFVFLVTLSVTASTAYTITASKGRRSFGWMNGIAMFIPFVIGLIFAGRANMASLVVVYYITCWAFGFRFRLAHLIVLICGTYVALFILFPYALYARNYTHSGNFDKNVSHAVSILEDVISNPGKYHDIETRKFGRSQYKFYYYGHPIPTLDRYSMIVLSDKIVDVTETQGTSGMKTITPGFLFSVPRIFFPEKPFYNVTTELAHRVKDQVGEKDRTTGISNSFIADGFSSYSWTGAFVIPFLIMFAYLAFYRLLLNEYLRYNILAISLVWHISYFYSEGTIGTQIIEVTENVFLFWLALLIMYRLIDLATLMQRRIRETKQRSFLGRMVKRPEPENASPA